MILSDTKQKQSTSNKEDVFQAKSITEENKMVMYNDDNNYTCCKRSFNDWDCTDPIVITKQATVPVYEIEDNETVRLLSIINRKVVTSFDTTT